MKHCVWYKMALYQGYTGGNIRICLTKKLWLKEVNRKLKAGEVTVEMLKSGKLC